MAKKEKPQAQDVDPEVATVVEPAEEAKAPVFAVGFIDPIVASKLNLGPAKRETVLDPFAREAVLAAFDDFSMRFADGSAPGLAELREFRAQLAAL